MQDYVERMLWVIERGTSGLRALSEAEAALRPAPGGWSPKEVVGHMIDSASNNHQRFLRAQFTDELVFPGYEQNEWVTAQRYQDAPWPELVRLWRSFNLHLAQVMAAVPDEARTRTRTRHNLDEIAYETVPAGEPTTLDYLMRDYVVHLEHHLGQISSLT